MKSMCCGNFTQRLNFNHFEASWENLSTEKTNRVAGSSFNLSSISPNCSGAAGYQMAPVDDISKLIFTKEQLNFKKLCFNNHDKTINIIDAFRNDTELSLSQMLKLSALRDTFSNHVLIQSLVANGRLLRTGNAFDPRYRLPDYDVILSQNLGDIATPICNKNDNANSKDASLSISAPAQANLERMRSNHINLNCRIEDKKPDLWVEMGTENSAVAPKHLNSELNASDGIQKVQECLEDVGYPHSVPENSFRKHIFNKSPEVIVLIDALRSGAQLSIDTMLKLSAITGNTNLAIQLAFSRNIRSLIKAGHLFKTRGSSGNSNSIQYQIINNHDKTIAIIDVFRKDTELSYSQILKLSALEDNITNRALIQSLIANGRLLRTGNNFFLDPFRLPDYEDNLSQNLGDIATPICNKSDEAKSNTATSNAFRNDTELSPSQIFSGCNDLPSCYSMALTTDAFRNDTELSPSQIFSGCNDLPSCYSMALTTDAFRNDAELSPSQILTGYNDLPSCYSMTLTTDDIGHKRHHTNMCADPVIAAGAKAAGTLKAAGKAKAPKKVQADPTVKYTPPPWLKL